jgi:hypothetical protein
MEPLREYGGTREAEIAVGVTAVLASQGPKRRRTLVFRNTSAGAHVITLGVGKIAVSGEGIMMNPNEEKFWTTDQAGGPPTQTITAVSNLAGGTLSIYED